MVGQEGPFGRLVAPWDVSPGEREIGKHSRLTPELVKVECPMSTAAGGQRLAGPFAVISGDAGAAERLSRSDPIPREQLDAYAAALRNFGEIDEIERLYGDLKTALRSRMGT